MPCRLVTRLRGDGRAEINTKYTYKFETLGEAIDKAITLYFGIEPGKALRSKFKAKWIVVKYPKPYWDESCGQMIEYEIPDDSIVEIIISDLYFLTDIYDDKGLAFMFVKSDKELELRQTQALDPIRMGSRLLDEFNALCLEFSNGSEYLQIDLR